MSATESEVQAVSLEEGLHGEDTEHASTSPRPRPGGPGNGGEATTANEPAPVQAGNTDQPEADPEPAPESPPAPSQEELEAAEAAKEQAKEDLAALAPRVEPQARIFGHGDMQYQYVQRELSVIGKAQWFGLVGEILDKAFTGEGALSLNGLLSPPQARQGQFGLSDFQDADTFVHAVGKLMIYAPEFLSKSVCIWLDVPDYEWDIVRAIMKLSPQEGGMSDQMFEDIFATFIDQNYEAINSFFRERARRLRARYQARAAETNQSRS